jgi:hypothetical protein
VGEGVGWRRGEVCARSEVLMAANKDKPPPPLHQSGDGGTHMKEREGTGQPRNDDQGKTCTSVLNDKQAEERKGKTKNIPN